MAMVVNTNVSSLIAQSAANATNKSLDTAMERLATGKRINSAADDAAGVAIASRLEAEIRGVNQAVRNAADAQAMIDTAEGAHIEITNILQRMREISVQSANDSNNATDRSYLQKEVNALVAEVDRIANTSTWAGKNLIKTASSFNFLLGSEKADNEITVTTGAMTGAALGIKAGNAAVGAQGATLLEVGENTLQVGGTPVIGDVYKFNINGENLAVRLVDDAGGLANFDYELSTDGGTSYAGVTNTGTDFIGQSSGKTAAGVAGIIAEVIDGRKANHPGLVVSANTDGAVTLLQKIDSLDLGYNDVSASATAIEDPWTKKSATTASFLNVTTGAVAATLAASSDTTHVYEIDLGGSPDDADKVGFTINGTNIVAETTLTNIAAAGYAKDKVGVSKWLNSQLQAATNAKGFSFEVGYVAAATNVYVTVTHSGADMIKDEGATPFASTNALTVGTQADAANAINTIDAALNTVNAQRADLGAVSNRMDSAIANLTNMSVNLSGGKSRIEDADFAAETAQLTKSQILQQAATSMLAQANASKQSVLSLLQG